MQCYTELTAPTAVSHSVALSFIGPKSTNLVIAKTSLIQIFELKSLVTEADANASDDVETLAQDIAADTLDRTFFTSDIALQKLETTSKLVLVAEYPLNGTITALGRVKNLSNAKTPADALIVAFRDAKISLVGWDTARHSITTISIHYYENSLAPTPWAQDLSFYSTFLTTDPNGRCALLRFGQRHVAILPFRQDTDELGGDDFDLDGDSRPHSSRKMTNGETGTTAASSHSASFVLSLTVLDASLIHPVHMAFLHEYREPTFGILSSTRSPSSSLHLERRDILTYKVFALDLQQRASTNVLSVPYLPSDLNRVIPLSLPVGGALLVGPNALVHVDQSGKTTAVAVNDMAKQLSSFSMSDQSQLRLRLENCLVEQLGDAGDMLIVTVSGQLAILSFSLDGRSVAGMSVHLVASEQGLSLVPTGISCCSAVGKNRLFFGNEDNDSILLGWSRKAQQLTKKRSLADMLGEDAEIDEADLDDLDDDDEDDLYGDSNDLRKSMSRASISDPISPESVIFRIHDRLHNFAPAGDMTLGKVYSPSGKPVVDSTGQDVLEMVFPSGRGRDGSLVITRKDIYPRISKEIELPNVKSIWTFHVDKAVAKELLQKGQRDSEAVLSADAAYDQYVLVSESLAEGEDESFLYTIGSKGDLKKVEDVFDTEGATVDIGIMSNGTKIVQVKVGEIRCYNSDLDLEQIIDPEMPVVSASFAGSHLIILRSDSTVIIFDESSGELEPLILSEDFASTKWLSACLYQPTPAIEGKDEKSLAFLLTPEGGMRVYELPNLEETVYTTDALPYLPAFIAPDFVPRRYAARQTLTEIMIANIGDETTKAPYLILRTSLDDLILYQPYHFSTTGPAQSFIDRIRWVKVSQPRLATQAEIYSEENEQTMTRPALRRLENVGGYSTVVQLGTSTNFILKEASSAAKVIRMTNSTSGRLTGLDTFHSSQCDRGFITVDESGTLCFCQLPPRARYGDSGWPMTKLPMGEEVAQVCYFGPKNLYAIATTKKVEFQLPEDDHHKEWVAEDTKFLPLTNQGYVKLLYPGDKDWKVIHSFELDPKDICLCMTTANLSTSEYSPGRKPFLCAGTLGVFGEDQASRGKIFVFDVIDVVPEPGKPETGHRLKVRAKEDVKGAVTAMQEIGPQGFLLVAQGQRAMVRGLIEAEKLVPVAFQDIQCFVTSAKVLRGTGMVLLGDVAKGVWFTGYTEEPYKMTLFGRTGSMEVTAAEFLPHEKNLYILAADADKNVHVLQYDPGNIRLRLIRRSTFHAGHFAVGMHLLPNTLSYRTAAEDDLSESASQNGVDSDESGDEMQKPESKPKRPQKIQQHVLVLNQTGSFALISPVDELLYLRLNALQTYLTGQLDHPCGLNPRGYRAAESINDAIGAATGGGGMGRSGGGAGGVGGGIKGVVDGTLLKRWSELPRQRQAEGCTRVGVEEERLRADLEVIGGEGLGYL